MEASELKGKEDQEARTKFLNFTFMEPAHNGRGAMEDGSEAVGAGAAVDVAGRGRGSRETQGRAVDTRPRASAALPEADTPARGGVAELGAGSALRLNSGSEV